LLVAHDQAGSFAEQPAVMGLREGAPEAPSSASGVRRAVGPGDRLGVYEIQAFVGAGGMGEVYKARDTRLDRSVAIKVLPAQLAADRDRFQRFEREARAVARLDHPHIGVLYDVGEASGLHFLVMQYLEGETLAARLTKGSLPLDQVLRSAIEIADALAHAHRRGIVHRDLKPGNIFLTKTGARLLDFGLAKWREVPPGDLLSGRSALATVPESLTDKGMIVGTLHYMAPEQLEGKETDARADLFAFGAVVYEMVTGKKAFDAGSSASVIAAILGTQPPAMATRQPLTPPALDQVVTTCLAKDPDERWQAAADVARQLRWIAEAGAQTQSVVAPAARRNRRGFLVVAVVALVVGGLLGGVLWSAMRSRSAPPPLQVTRSNLSAPIPILDDLALSPDGTRLAYVDEREGKPRIYLRLLNELEAKPIEGTDDAGILFFSPDGQWLGFSARTKLMKVALTGGAPQTICDCAPIPMGAAWGSDGTIVFAPTNRSGLYTVPAAGGTPQVLTQLDEHEKSHRQPQFIPGSNAVLFTVTTPDMTSFDEARIGIVALDNHKRRVVINGGSSPRFVRTGHLLYSRGASLMAVPFDPRRLEIAGQPISVLDSVRSFNDGGALFTVSEAGLVAYVPGEVPAAHDRLIWVDRQGKVQPLTDARQRFGSVRLSPDGQRLALMAGGVNEQVWTYDLARGTLSRLTFEWDNQFPTWTPDGAGVVFRSDRSGVFNLYSQTWDGSSPAERLTESPDPQFASSWTPDGKNLAFVNNSPKTGFDIWLLTTGPERRAHPLIQTPFNEFFPTFSPDGHWLAYVSNETGRDEVYIRPFPGLGAKWQVSTDGGMGPSWEPKHGRELYYQNRSKLMAVAIQTTPKFAAAAPRVLFDAPYVEGFYDVAPDGRFIMIDHKQSEPPASQITLITNWFEELKRRVPTP